MLWLAFHLPHLSLDAIMPPPGTRGAGARAHAVIAVRGPRRWVVDSSDPRIAPGVDWGSAQAILPQLQGKPRDLRAEKRMLDTLCTWAWRFGSEVVGEIVESPLDYGRPQHRVAVNIATSLKLFGGLDALLAEFDRSVIDVGHRIYRGVAPTLDAAILLARAGIITPVVEPAGLRAALDPLPLALLDQPPAIRRKLHALGLKKLGGLLDLPFDGLARRYGPALIEDLERLLGARADGRVRHRLPPRYSRRFDLGSEVENVEGLALPLRRLVQQFTDYLRARDAGVQEFILTLEHARHRITKLDLRLASATREPGRLLRVIRERLDREALPHSVQALRLSAHRFPDPSCGQNDLFDTERSEDWIGLLETLRARLGPDAVHALAKAEDWRPERAWMCAEPETETSRRMPPVPSRLQTRQVLKVVEEKLPGRRKSPDRPLWLLEPPRELATVPFVTSSPERIETGWWDGADISRDYYDVQLGSSRAWVFQDRKTDAWFLHGLWA